MLCESTLATKLIIMCKQKSSLTTTEDAKFTREFKVTVRLGKGGYGVVYGARHILDEADYAVKIIKLNPKRYCTAQYFQACMMIVHDYRPTHVFSQQKRCKS